MKAKKKQTNNKPKTEDSVRRYGKGSICHNTTSTKS